MRCVAVALLLLAIAMPSAEAATDLAFCQNPPAEDYQRLWHNNDFQDYVALVNCGFNGLEECWVLERTDHPIRMVCGDWTATPAEQSTTASCFAQAEYEWRTPTNMTCTLTYATKAAGGGGGWGPLGGIVAVAGVLGVIWFVGALSGKPSVSRPVAMQLREQPAHQAETTYAEQAYWNSGGASFPAPDHLRCHATTLKGYRCERYSGHDGNCWQH